MHHFQNQMGKWDLSKFSNIEKWGISRMNHVIDFKSGKGPKMNLFDFWASQRKKQMTSHDKILLRVLFGAFHSTSRSHQMTEMFNHLKWNVCDRTNSKTQKSQEVQKIWALTHPNCKILLQQLIWIAENLIWKRLQCMQEMQNTIQSDLPRLLWELGNRERPRWFSPPEKWSAQVIISLVLMNHVTKIHFRR